MRDIGIIGLGTIARHQAQAVLACGGQVVAACGRSRASPRRAAFAEIAPDCRLLDRIDDLLAENKLDGIIACASWDQMPGVAKKLMDWGKPVLLEKPIAFDAQATRHLIQAAGIRNDILVGYNRRYYETVDALRQRLATERPIGVSTRLCETVIRQKQRFGETIVENLLAFSTAHSLDLLLHLLGPLKVGSQTSFVHEGEAAPFRSHSALLETTDKIPVLLEIAGEDPGPSEIRFRFSDGSAWRLSPLETLTAFQGVTVEEATIERPFRQYTPNTVKTIFADTHLKPGMLNQMRAFLNQDFGPGASLEDALAVMELIDTLNADRS